ncbi:MAG: hypothetical protein B6D56_06085 [Candidatus Omnitrophica bacterium 4484_70.1]|nr:MAG: hypothetical protein B6D56_06085 [Candidatus Omnitrophica bacterium 4484_70.1]
MERTNIKNVKCQQKTPKAERILIFALCNFSTKGGSPSGGHFAMLYSPNRLGRVGEYKSLSQSVKRLRKEKTMNETQK